jgi:hypothetical protein
MNHLIATHLSELLARQATNRGTAVALRWWRAGCWHDMTWRDYHADSLAVPAALVKWGVEPGDRVGLVSANRPEWFVGRSGRPGRGGAAPSPGLRPDRGSPRGLDRSSARADRTRQRWSCPTSTPLAPPCSKRACRRLPRGRRWQGMRLCGAG